MERLTQRGEIYAGTAERNKYVNRLQKYEDLLEQYNIPDLATIETLLKANAEGRVANGKCTACYYAGNKSLGAGSNLAGMWCEAHKCWIDHNSFCWAFTRQEAESALEKEKSNE